MLHGMHDLHVAKPGLPSPKPNPSAFGALA
jgi:hypothetical protein